MKHVHRSCPFFSFVFEWRFKLRYTERSASLSVLCSINRIYFNDFLLLKASCWEMIRTALCSWQSAVWLFNCIWTIQDQTLKIFQRERNCLVLTVTWKCSTGCVFWIERLSSYELSSVWKVQHFRVIRTGFSWLRPMSLLNISTNSLPCSVGTGSVVTARSFCRGGKWWSVLKKKGNMNLKHQDREK